MSMPPKRLDETRTQAFSLVEVVISIGIVSFALLSILSFFGGMLVSSRENANRRELIEAVGTLRAYLNEVGSPDSSSASAFMKAFDFVTTGSPSGQELIYVTYIVDKEGNPVDFYGNASSGDLLAGDSHRVVGKWVATNDALLPSYEKARTGRWLKAKLSRSPSNPADTVYTNTSAALFFVNVEIGVVPTPNQSTTNSASLNTTLAVRR
jgi:type II secretory pathway pseudopilin PulG